MTTLATVILTVLALTSSASTADRLAAAGDVLVGATLLLAAIAALVALLAYAVSTGPPDLEISVRFPFSHPNNPKFVADFLQPGRLRAKSFKQIDGSIQLRNNGGYSAKNPAVIVRLNAMAFRYQDSAWTMIDFATTVGAMAIQWDGGLAYSIHGHSTRRLPDLHLEDLDVLSQLGPPFLAIEILADGYRKDITLPVDFIVDDKSQFHREEETVNPEWM